MLPSGNSFLIEGDLEINEENLLSNVFTTTSVNRAKPSRPITGDIKNGYESVKNNDIKGAIANPLVRGERYDITRDDLLNMLSHLFGEESSIYGVMRNLISYLTKAEMAFLNVLIGIGKVIDRIAGTICSILEGIKGLILGMPILKFIDALVGLILLTSSSCKNSIYAIILSKILDNQLARYINIRLIYSALDLGDDPLLREVLSHDGSKNLIEWYPHVEDLIVGEWGNTVTKNDPNITPFDPWVSPATWESEDSGVLVTRATAPVSTWTPWIAPDDWFKFQGGLDNVSPNRVTVKGNSYLVSGDRFSEAYRRHSYIFSSDHTVQADPTKAPAIKATHVRDIVSAVNTEPPYVIEKELL